MGADDPSVVHAVTAPVNLGSIAFHRSIGFELSGPVTDYDGPGNNRVVLSLNLEAPRAKKHA